MKQVIPTIIIALLVGFIGYKIGDSRGFESGYKVGYSYDCKDEIQNLRSAHEDLKKALEFADKKANDVQRQNKKLRDEKFRMEHREDSIKWAPHAKRINDSLAKAGFPRSHLDIYTGEIKMDLLELIVDEQKNKKASK